MKLMPLDIRQKEFPVMFRGYDQNEVLQFLEKVADQVESLIAEKNQYQETIRGLEEQLKRYQELEETLKKTIITTQQIKDEMKLSAKKEYDLVVAEAKLEANKILSEAQKSITFEEKELQELKRQKELFRDHLRTLINSHLKLLNTFE